jgi:PAS domain S-box-containing protein
VCDWYNTPIVDANGEVIGVSSLIQDITDRVGSELESKRTTDLLEYSQQAARVGGWELNLETGELYWTDETYRIHDTSPKEFNPTVDAGVSYFLPDAQEIITEALTRATELGEGYALELDTFTTKGRLISVYTTCKVTMRNGKPYLLTGIFQDITERKREKDNFLREQRRLESILETAADSVVIVDRLGAIVSINKAAEEMFLLRSDEVVGQNVSLLMPESDGQAHDGYMSRYYETGAKYLIGNTRDLTAKRSDGSHFSMQISLSEWSHGDEQFFTGVIRDMTEQKEVLARLIQSQKMESLAQLSGGLAHDFNNLLAIVIGNLDILAGQLDLDSENMERLETAIHAAERGADITGRMLKLTRSDQSVASSVEALDINELLVELVTLFRRTLDPTYQINLELDTQPIWVRVNKSEFENVVLNLCVNARDAMPDGGEMTISTEVLPLLDSVDTGSDGSREMVQVSLSDNGPGMSSELITRIFEPFFSTKAGKGSGLGLAMAYSFAASHEGEIKAVSEPGEGTTMQLRLPISNGTDVSPRHGLVKEVPGGSETILVVDDEPDLVVVTEKILQSLGYEVITVASVSSALTVLQSQRRVDLLLSDVVMPGGVLGPELAQLARDARPSIRVVLMSGYVDLQRFSDKAMDASIPLLSKPFRKAELATVVRQALA